MTLLSRRGILGALIAAPAIVRVESLMHLPRRQLIRTSLEEGIVQEFDALQRYRVTFNELWTQVSRELSDLHVYGNTPIYLESPRL